MGEFVEETIQFVQPLERILFRPAAADCFEQRRRVAGWRFIAHVRNRTVERSLGQCTSKRIAMGPESGYYFSVSVIEIRNAVSALPEKDRAELAVWLLDSLTEHGDEDALADSIAEADRRRADLELGQSSLLSESEFWSRVERKR
jgi:hypothetical protein